MPTTSPAKTSVPASRCVDAQRPGTNVNRNHRMALFDSKSSYTSVASFRAADRNEATRAGPKYAEQAS